MSNSVNAGTVHSAMGIDVSPFEKGLANARNSLEKFSNKAEEVSNKVKNVGSKMSDTGKNLSLKLTAPLAALGGAAIKTGLEFNEGMANVATLMPGNIERVEELKKSIQGMAVDVGKSTSDLSDGLYQTVSAFGDTADTAEILKINAQAAAAGIASTTESINLTSAVTKGYGDTSAEAVQKAADLAFQTVKLGQTTFPELASSMGKVIPLASTMKVKQEELFGAMATLTGVTGNAAEVSTQLRASIQAVMKPTKDMQNAMIGVVHTMVESGEITGKQADDFKRLKADSAALTKELMSVEKGTEKYKGLEIALKENQKALENTAGGMGNLIIENKGLAGTFEELNKHADGNNMTLGKMYGSVEGLNAVLALTGEQSQNFSDKTAAMQVASGSATEAFKEQSEGVNKAGFDIKKMKIEMELAAQKVSETLIPSFHKLVLTVSSLANKFGNLSPGTQETIVKVLALVAAIGPALFVGGKLVSVVGTLISVFGTVSTAVGVATGAVTGASGAAAVLGSVLTVLTGPVGLIIAALAAFAVALKVLYDKNENFRTKVDKLWLKIQNMFENVVNYIKVFFAGWLQFMTDLFAVFKAAFSGDWNLLMTAIQTLIDNAVENIKTIFKLGLEIVANILDIAWTTIATITSTIWAGIGAFLSTMLDGIKKNFSESVSNIKESVKTGFRDMKENIRTKIGEIKENISNTWETLKNDTLGFARDMISNFAQGVRDKVEDVKNSVKSIADTVKNFLGFGKNKDPKEGPGKGASEWGGNLIDMFAGKIRAGVGKVKSAAKRVANAVKDYLGFSSPTKEGPGSNADKWALNLMDMFADGISSKEKLVKDKVSSVADTIKNGLAVTSSFLGGVGSINAKMSISKPKLPDMSALNIPGAAYSMAGAGGRGTGQVIDYERLAKAITDNVKPSVKMENTYNSPKALKASDVNREQQKLLRDLGAEWEV